MKHQEVCVDYWAMGKALITYAGMTVMGWIMLRLFNTVFTLPGKMRAQQNQIQNTLAELQQRFPDIKITEEDLKNAEKELAAIMQEDSEMKEKAQGEISGEKEKLATEIGEKETGESEATGGKKEANTSFAKEDKKSI